MTQLTMDAASVEDRLRSWLPRKPYRPQPYEQLGGVYRREGHEPAARTCQSVNSVPVEPITPAGGFGGQRDMECGTTLEIGYGYRPVLALIPLVVLMVFGSVLF